MNMFGSAEDVLLLKNTRIGSNSVVGAKSLVNGEIPPNSLAAGTPARVIREDISWRYSGGALESTSELILAVEVMG